jgi:DNA (cytosine-5)-methyltransferase 1
MCSYADIHRPKYAVFENVVAIAANRKGFEDQNVLSQVVACFVSMGYQVNQYIMDAWTYGSCQQRSRVMVTIAAPGLVPIQQPKHTHSMLSNETAARSLGSLPNGQRFGGREYYSTPFAHISAGAATSDLPDIGNGNIQTCISHPNHRVSAPPSRKERALLACIPREPPCCGYAEAYKLGLIPSTLQKPSKESGRAYRRIHCDGLVPTITTGLSIQDSRNGATVHWSQDSPITILFARRTQGYLDHEPIIGTLAEQYKIVGNGVDRHVAFALGLAIRKAIVSNKQQDGVSASDMLVDVEQDDDHFSEAAGTCSADDSDLDADMTDIPGLDGTSDVRDNLPMPPPLHNSSLLLRVSKTITSGIKDLAHRSRYYPPPTPATSNPSKRSLEWISEGVDDGSFRHDDDGQASASREPNLVDMKETGNTAQDKVVRNGDVASKTGRVGTKSGYTRHSGLEVVFTPKQWNQKPEREHHTSD